LDKWYQIQSDGIVNYNIGEPIGMKIENYHNIPIYFSIFERKEIFSKENNKMEKLSVKIYPNNDPIAFKTLNAKIVGKNEQIDNFIEVDFGKCEYSSNTHGTIEFQDVIVEVSTTKNLKQIRNFDYCVVSLPYVLAVSPTRALLSTTKPQTVITRNSIDIVSKIKEEPQIIKVDEISELLNQLANMGFNDEQKNEVVLRKNNMDIEKSVTDLVASFKDDD